ncbi:MAG: hypothetical protein GY820_39610 [Gammaproteobacteria bacterium]|nr:hypothetical protein [Gammaproteobacteria bacterium]
MASGDTLLIFVPQSIEYGTGQHDVRNDQHPVYDMVNGEIAVVSGVLPAHYADTTGVTVYLHYAMSTAQADQIRLDTTFERIGDQQGNLDVASFDATGVDGTDTTVPGTTGLVDIVSNAHSKGARMDSLAVGEGFRMKVTRSAVAGDDAPGDLELRFIEIIET